jgi:IS30 family transposase
MIYDDIESLTTNQRAKIRKRHRGLIRGVAKQLYVAHGAVSRECRGMRQSERIRTALLAALNQREAELTKADAA